MIDSGNTSSNTENSKMNQESWFKATPFKTVLRKAAKWHNPKGSAPLLPYWQGQTVREHDLLEMLTYRRPCRSKAERKFINRYLRPLGVREDSYGNLLLRVGKSPRVAWCSHTDTVHLGQGRQRVKVDSKGVITTDSGDCLGADDTTGVWLMREMVFAKIPGLYIFHRDEESGAQGSKHIAKETPEVFDGIDYAIAFDRRGVDSVITHQAGGRCASDAFAKALASQLGPNWKADSTGIFTDTDNYTDVVGECSNVSVGYEGAHSSKESQSLPFAIALLESIMTLDFTTIPVERKAGEYESRYSYLDSFGGREDWSAYRYDDKATLVESSRLTARPKSRAYRSSSQWDVYTLCRTYPDVAADMLESLGVDGNELARHGIEVGLMSDESLDELG